MLGQADELPLGLAASELDAEPLPVGDAGIVSEFEGGADALPTMLAEPAVEALMLGLADTLPLRVSVGDAVVVSVMDALDVVDPEVLPVGDSEDDAEGDGADEALSPTLAEPMVVELTLGLAEALPL